MEIAILAGGLSSRMGRDKAGLKFRGRTMLTYIREAAKASGLPVRVIRRDAVPRCGPLGGIYTGLETTSAVRVLFLACDMPFVSPDLIEHVLRRKGREPVFLSPRQGGRCAGFPLVLPRGARSLVARQIRSKKFSLQSLARGLGAKIVRVPRRFSGELRNINTPAEWKRAVRDWGDELG
jgi:molybdopterin-guanine dinucleotide biosynthesis protein A